MKRAARGGSSRVDPQRVDPSRVDPSRVDPSRVDPSRVDPSRVDLERVDAERRAAFRAFVRTHHPDVGGDPEVFRAGLAALVAAQAPPGGPAPDDPRLDAPITAVPSGAVHRLGRAGRRLIRRYDPRPGSARVV